MSKSEVKKDLGRVLKKFMQLELKKFHRNFFKLLERAKGFEPSTSTLARWHSTTELRPLTKLLLNLT